MGAMVSISNLTKEFGEFIAVDNVSFSADKGEVIGFLGPNGAGKSTTMRMATGFITPTSGSVIICGENILENPIAAQKHIGYLPEGGPLYNDMTPASFLKFIGNIRGLHDARLKERLDFVAEKLHLDKVWYQIINTLSKGYKRRVALAQAIMHDPDVLILDEPTDGLDPNQKFEVQQLILSMAKEKAIVISTHILEEVEAVCSRALIIANGRIIASGTPLELAAKDPINNSVIIKVSGSDSSKIMNALRSLKSIKNIEAHNDNEILLIPSGNKDIISEVAGIIRKEKFEIEEIYAKHGRLNEAFRMLTKQGEDNK